MSIHIKEAYPRIDDALDSGRTVMLTDGTVTAKVTKVFGDADDIDEKHLTLALEGFAVKNLAIEASGYLDGIGLRDTGDFLLIGPDNYISKWPCSETQCIANYDGCCSVDNCKGPCTRSKNTTRAPLPPDEPINIL